MAGAGAATTGVGDAVGWWAATKGVGSSVRGSKKSMVGGRVGLGDGAYGKVDSSNVT